MTHAPSPPKGWHTVGTLASQLGIGRDWVKVRLRGSDYTFTAYISMGQLREYYSPDAQVWLRQQLRQHRKYLPMGSAVSIRQAAEYLGCDTETIPRLMATHHLAIRHRRSPNNRVVACIAAQDLRTLRASQSQKSTAAMITLYQMRLACGLDEETVMRFLKSQGFQPIWLTSGHSGHRARHFPVVCFQLVLARKSTLQPAGSWMTAHRIAVTIGRSEKWVDRRLIPYQASARRLLDDNAAVRLHYSPWVCQALWQLSIQQRTSASKQASAA